MNIEAPLAHKSFLVHVEATEESDRRLEAAVRFARATNATLQGVGGCKPSSVDNPWIATSYQLGSVIEAVNEQEAEDLKEAERRFHAAAACLGASTSWTSARDYPDLALQALAAGADVIITSIRRGPEATTAAAADLVMRAGVPVLALPDFVTRLQARRIIVAWKNTREARRAVSDALPLLAAAEEVTVIAAAEDQEDGNDSLGAVLGRLKRHGISAETLRLEKSDIGPADAFLHAAENSMADMIVAGAYGHSRLREWVLGGFTQALLARSRIPVHFSH